MTGRKINNLHQLDFARTQRKAVICPSNHCFKGPVPAAFVINMSGEILLRLINAGMYVYKKK